MAALLSVCGCGAQPAAVTPAPAPAPSRPAAPLAPRTHGTAAPRADVSTVESPGVVAEPRCPTAAELPERSVGELRRAFGSIEQFVLSAKGEAWATGSGILHLSPRGAVPVDAHSFPALKQELRAAHFAPIQVLLDKRGNLVTVGVFYNMHPTGSRPPSDVASTALRRTGGVWREDPRWAALFPELVYQDAISDVPAVITLQSGRRIVICERPSDHGPCRLVIDDQAPKPLETPGPMLLGAATATDLWAVFAGGSGVSVRLGHLVQDSWVFFTTRELENVQAIAAMGSSVWLVTADGALLSHDGNHWKPPSCVPWKTTTALAALSNSDVWLGSEQAVAHYDGREWTRVPGLKWTTSIVALPDSSIFVSSGSDVHYRLSSPR